MNNWDTRTFHTIRDFVVQDQHGPQSLVEALLVPVFGFGFTESRLIVSTLGLLSLILIVAWATVSLNKWFGLLAGLSIGMAPYCLYFSRSGDSEHVNIYLQGFLLLYAAQRCVQRGFVRDYSLLGLAGGLSLYVYATNQLLCVMVLGLVALFQIAPLIRSGWTNCLVRIVGFLLPAVATAGPMINHHIKNGRSLLLRTPYGTPNYEFSKTQDLASQVLKLGKELFVQGGDPWFARPHGALADYTLFLLIPGVITIVALLRRSRGIQTRSFYFLCAVTAALVLFGGFPAALSPGPAFRRAVLLAIGLDIIKAFGCYGLALAALRQTPKFVAYGLIGIVLISYAAYDWSSFLFDSHTTESNSGNSRVATIQYVRESVEHNKDAIILLPLGQGFLQRDDFTLFLTFQLGYPKELPASVRMIDLPDLASGALNDVIVPFQTYQRIVSKSAPLPEGVQYSNPRIFSNRMGETFVLVDFIRGVP